jgi:hypothetical protein
VGFYVLKITYSTDLGAFCREIHREFTKGEKTVVLGNWEDVEGMEWGSRIMGVELG